MAAHVAASLPSHNKSPIFVQADICISSLAKGIILESCSILDFFLVASDGLSYLETVVEE